MKIAIMSDSHDDWINLEKAVTIANERGCTHLLFAGDLIAPTGISILGKFKGEVKFVWGNNEGERVGLTRKMDASEKIELCGDVYEDTIGEVRVFMTHKPRIAELAAKSDEFDLCIHGHTHAFRNEEVNGAILMNPGGIKGSNSSFAIFDLETREVQQIAL
ncbi:YfcE family phosphodiesterase [candidate division WWE3 bacterium]|nr:YfcE family phosphodiesterase [candidate division WWE3 bacterium]